MIAVMNWTAKILAGMLTAFLALACLIPSLSVNITAHAAKGESWHAGAVYIVAVLVAAVCIIARRIARRSNDFDTARACLILAVILLSFNVKNAWNSSTISRAEFGDPRRAENVILTRLHGEEKRLQEILAKSSPRASTVIQADIDLKLQDPKADGCPVGGAWNGPVTKEVCPEVGRLRTEKAAAVAYEADKLALAEVRWKLSDPAKREKTVTDPTVQNVGMMLGLAMTVTDTTQKWIGIGDDLHVALVVESLAILGPDICLFLFLTIIAGLRREPNQPRAEPEILTREEIVTAPEPLVAKEIEAEILTIEEAIPDPVMIAPPEPVATVPTEEAPRPPQKQGGRVAMKKGRNVTIPTAVQKFFDVHVARAGNDDSIGATDFYEAYAGWAGENGEEVVSPNMFGRAASATYKKAEGRTNRYVGIKLKGMRPKLKAVKS